MCVCVSKLDRKGGYSTDSLFHPTRTRIPTFYLIDKNKPKNFINDRKHEGMYNVSPTQIIIPRQYFWSVMGYFLSSFVNLSFLFFLFFFSKIAYAHKITMRLAIFVS